ncbi:MULTISPECIES: hypothetical protein [Caproicibacterium]|jgi:hypothetical protein|uniref:hypothetical protein n=1 Tax=Caproicibacterium TaxID=2834348 RepID=UPI001573C001|nr:hypothetical protein [Caproicibacterium lactatifermentans]MDD4808239.1 hypothetical protein [Oscillospiraceae bacterium]
MSPKELSYVEDALEHEQFLQTQCENAASSMTDPQLKQCVKQMTNKHQQTFQQFLGLL